MRKIDFKIINSIILEAKTLTPKLLKAKITQLIDIPKNSGVYLVYNRNHQILYVGQAVNLKRRILEDHLGGDKKMSTSTLRRRISKVYNKNSQEVRNWIRKKCLFSYIIVEEHDIRHLVENLVISYFRKIGEPLLNFYKK